RTQPAAFPRDFKQLAISDRPGVRARADGRARPFCLTIGRLSILAARATPSAVGLGSSGADQRGGATAYGAVRAWHAACDSAVATVLERLRGVKRRTSDRTPPPVRPPSDLSPAACLPPRRDWHLASRRRFPPRPKRRLKSASSIRSPAPWRSARPR